MDQGVYECLVLMNAHIRSLLEWYLETIATSANRRLVNRIRTEWRFSVHSSPVPTAKRYHDETEMKAIQRKSFQHPLN